MDMKVSKLYGAALAATLVAACGGGGSGGVGAGPAVTYAYVTPKANTQRIYASTFVDNSNNTIAVTSRARVVSVNVDGSFVEFLDNPTGSSGLVNGTSYTQRTETVTVNSSGQALLDSYVVNDLPVTCTIAPHGPGPDSPVSVGQAWALQYTATCGTSTPVTYSQSGSVVGIEPVVVPAGSFSALKILSTIVWTDPNGTTRTETITSWRDTATAMLVKRITNTGYSGTALVNGFPLSATVVLQSQS